MVRNALFCLEMAADEKENHVYTKALMAYAFALAGKEEKRKALLSSLEKEAVKKGECSCWDISFFQPTGLASSLDKMVFVGGAMAAGTGFCGWGKVQGEEKLVQRGCIFENSLTVPGPTSLLQGSSYGSTRHHPHRC